MITAVTTLLAGLAAATTAQPAAADQQLPEKTVTRASWAYTDLADPHRAKVDATGDAPIGASVDRKGLHVSRSYFTVDLGELQGKHVLGAALSLRETRAADCAHRAVELWTTAPFTATSSWVNPPAEQERLVTSGKSAASCVPGITDLDVSAAVTKALQAGQAKLTLELRVPGRNELDPRFARWFANDLTVKATYNTPPPVPANPNTTPGGPCVTTAPGAFVRADGITSFHADAVDADPGQALTAQWSLWSVDDPAVRRDIDWPVANGKAYAQFDNPGLPSDRTYAWKLRVTDGTDTSDWTPTCYYTPDSVRPAVPSVKSDVYLTSSSWDPRGGIGIPGDFTFSPEGSTDVVKYEYRIGGSDWTPIAADGPGGTATITYTPTDSGQHSVGVRSIDRANNYSWEEYRGFEVRNIRPWVWSTLYPNTTTNPGGNVGVPGVFEFHPGMPDVVSYTYRLENGPAQTVPADAEGEAQVTLAPAHGGENVLYVSNTDQVGTVSTDHEYKFVVDTAPVITDDSTGGRVVGSPMLFTLAPRLAGTTEYLYWFQDSQGHQTDTVTLPAGPDGTANFTWTPRSSAALWLRAQSRDSAGTLSEVRVEYLSVNGAMPYITMDGAGAPGVPGTFVFASAMRNITEYVYWFSTDPAVKRTIPAGPDGKANLTWAPAKGGSTWVQAQARNADGVLSDEGSKYFYVDDSPIVSSAEFPRDRTAGRFPGTFHLAPRLPGTVEYVYRLDGAGPVTVPADADGTASFPYTPALDGWHYLQVRSRAADGTMSEYMSHSFQVSSAPKVSSVDYPDDVYAGEPGIPGVFAFEPGAPDLTEYVYEFRKNGQTPEPEATVPAGAGGKASVTWAPVSPGGHTVTVRSKHADGTLSPQATYSFYVDYPRG